MNRRSRTTLMTYTIHQFAFTANYLFTFEKIYENRALRTLKKSYKSKFQSLIILEILLYGLACHFMYIPQFTKFFISRYIMLLKNTSSQGVNWTASR